MSLVQITFFDWCVDLCKKVKKTYVSTWNSFKMLKQLQLLYTLVGNSSLSSPLGNLNNIPQRQFPWSQQHACPCSFSWTRFPSVLLQVINKVTFFQNDSAVIHWHGKHVWLVSTETTGTLINDSEDVD